MQKHSQILSYCLLLLALAFMVHSCERDDICSNDTETTPRLIIRFYDIANPDSFKNIQDVRVQGVDNDELVSSDYNGTKDLDSLVLPLKTTDMVTEYRIHSNYAVNNNGTPDDTSDDFIEGNEDIIRIEYALDQIYVSRACGYKSIFENVEILPQDDGDNWIQYVQPVNDIQTIENERAAHFKIYH